MAPTLQLRRSSYNSNTAPYSQTIVLYISHTQICNPKMIDFEDALPACMFTMQVAESSILFFPTLALAHSWKSAFPGSSIWLRDKLLRMA